MYFNFASSSTRSAFDQQQALWLDVDPRSLGNEPGGQGTGLGKVLKPGGNVLVTHRFGQLIDLRHPLAGTPKNLPVADDGDGHRAPLPGGAHHFKPRQINPLAPSSRITRPGGRQANVDRTGRLLRQANLDLSLLRGGRIALLDRSDRIGGCGVGDQFRAGRKTDAKAVESRAVTLYRERRFRVDAASVDPRGDNADRLQRGRDLGGASPAGTPRQFELAAGAQDGEFALAFFSGRRQERGPLGDLGDCSGQRGLELQFRSGRPRKQQLPPRLVADGRQRHERLQGDLVLPAGRSVKPGDVSFAVVLEVDELLAGTLAFRRREEDGLVEAERHADPLVVADEDAKLDRKFGVSAGGRPAGGNLLDAVVRPLFARRQLVLQPIKFLEVLEAEVGHRLEIALFVLEVVKRRLGFLDMGRRRWTRLGGRGFWGRLAAAGDFALVRRGRGESNRLAAEDAGH